MSKAVRLGFVLSANRVGVVLFDFDRARSLEDEFRVVNAMAGMTYRSLRRTEAPFVTVCP